MAGEKDAWKVAKWVHTMVCKMVLRLAAEMDCLMENCSVFLEAVHLVECLVVDLA